MLPALPPGKTQDPAARILIDSLCRKPPCAEAQGYCARLDLWEDVVALALSHGVAGCLQRALGESGVLESLPAGLRARLVEVRRATALANLQLYGQFQRVAHAFREQGIALIALKGIDLAERAYGDISLRPMSDIDVLIRAADLARAVSALHALGYGKGEDLGAEAEGLLQSKCNLGLAHAATDVWLEVHWSLDEPPNRYQAAVEAIWASARPSRLGDAETLVMRPEFLLLHVCAHLACNHCFAFGLKALCDIAELAHTQTQMDWGLIVDQGRRHPWKRGVAAALWLAREHLHAPIPAQVLHALGAERLDRAMLDEAMMHLLASRGIPDTLLTAPNLLALSGNQGVLRKLATVWTRVFVSRAELALLYGISERSAILPLYYLQRLVDLMRRYAAGAWALQVGDRSLAASASRQARLASWVREEC